METIVSYLFCSIERGIFFLKAFLNPCPSTSRFPLISHWSELSYISILTHCERNGDDHPFRHPLSGGWGLPLNSCGVGGGGHLDNIWVLLGKKKRGWLLGRQPMVPAMAWCTAWSCIDNAETVKSGRSGFKTWITLVSPGDRNPITQLLQGLFIFKEDISITIF